MAEIFSPQLPLPDRDRLRNRYLAYDAGTMAGGWIAGIADRIFAL